MPVPQIVTVDVSINVAPAPSQLQRTGALVTQGGTDTAAGTKTLLTEASDLTAILKDALALTSVAWAGGTVTATTAAPHGYANGLQFLTTIAGVTPVAYNGTYLITITGASTFTYALVSNPGVQTVAGTYTPASASELLAMVTSFFNQGAQQAVYVLELGAGSSAQGVTALGTYITANPGVFYIYVVPRLWSDEASYLTFVAGFETPESETYFYTTVDADNYTDFTNLMKCVFAVIEAPGIPATEFVAAMAAHIELSYAPSSTDRVTPYSFGFLYGATAYPTAGNAALLTALKAANINYVASAAEGGLSNTMIVWGKFLDGKPVNYWYSVDWVQINSRLMLAATIINGSNNSANPLYYNQDGINRLQAAEAQVMANAITYGLALGTVVQTQMDQAAFLAALNAGKFNGLVVVNAIPFIPYVTANPTHYPNGVYNGLTVVYTPLRGFETIAFNLVVTDFIVQ